MGTWAAHTFGNDAACDWTYGLEEVDDLSLVLQAIEAVLEAEDDSLDAYLAREGLAACEVIARLKGNWGLRNAYSESLDQWVETHQISPSENLVQSALAVIDRVLGQSSELRELWEEGDASEWRQAVDNLRERVGA